MVISRNNNAISGDILALVQQRFKNITKIVNRTFWDLDSDDSHAYFVGSYGRGTAINTSDVDILIELPLTEKERVDNCKYNSQSYLLQIVKEKIVESYPRSDIKADGQVVIINFSDGIVFEIVPVFKKYNNWSGKYEFIYPDSNNGGRWQSTNPLAEQRAMDELDDYYQSNGLLKDTCKFLRYIRDEYFSSYSLSGILIDSFVYWAIGDWHFKRTSENDSSNSISYEEVLFNKYKGITYGNNCLRNIYAPGSGMSVDTKDWEILGKVLKKVAEK